MFNVFVVIIIVWGLLMRLSVKGGRKKTRSKEWTADKTRSSSYQMPEFANPQTSDQAVRTAPSDGMVMYLGAVPAAKPKKDSQNLKKKYRETGLRAEAKYRRLEDRENDWLARQIREESKRKKNSCFDPASELKRSHAASCDARSLAREHASAHRKGRI